MTTRLRSSEMRTHEVIVASSQGSHARCSRVGAGQRIGMTQDVFSANLVVERIEAEGRLRLRLTIQLSLKAPDPSTTLADLLPPLLVANPFSAMRASLRRWSSDEFEDGVAHGWQGRLGRGARGSFFFALQLQGGDAGGRRTRSSS